jgi:hypothetical protein
MPWGSKLGCIVPEEAAENSRAYAITMRELADSNIGGRRDKFLRMAAIWDKLAAEAENKSGRTLEVPGDQRRRTDAKP